MVRASPPGGGLLVQTTVLESPYASTTSTHLFPRSSGGMLASSGLISVAGLPSRVAVALQVTARPSSQTVYVPGARVNPLLYGVAASVSAKATLPGFTVKLNDWVPPPVRTLSTISRAFRWLTKVQTMFSPAANPMSTRLSPGWKSALSPAPPDPLRAIVDEVAPVQVMPVRTHRSEERRVGKECRSGE